MCVVVARSRYGAPPAGATSRLSRAPAADLAEQSDGPLEPHQPFFGARNAQKCVEVLSLLVLGVLLCLTVSADVCCNILVVKSC